MKTYVEDKNGNILEVYIAEAAALVREGQGFNRNDIVAMLKEYTGLNWQYGRHDRKNHTHVYYKN